MSSQKRKLERNRSDADQLSRTQRGVHASAGQRNAPAATPKPDNKHGKHDRKPDKESRSERLANLSLGGVIKIIRGKGSGRGTMTRYAVMVGIMFVVCVCVDLFLPKYNTWMNIVRTILAVIAAVPVFMTGYGIAIRQSVSNEKRFNDEIDREAAEDGVDPDKARENDTEGLLKYQPYRLRYSYSTRLKQALIVGAILASLAILTSFSPVYTFVAACVLAGIFGCVCYCRPTHVEKFYRDNDMQDPRDVRMEEIKRQREITQKALIEIRQHELMDEKEEREERRRLTGETLFGSAHRNNRRTNDDLDDEDTDALADELMQSNQ